MSSERQFARGCGRVLLVGLIGLTVVMAGCSTQTFRRAPAKTSTAKVPGGAAVDLGKQSRRSPGVGRKARGISINGRCKQTDHGGYTEDATVRVAGGKVTQLDWKIRMGKRGTCRFDGKKFRQTKSSPSVELIAKDGSGCKLLMWSDPRRVTLAHAGCAKFCTRGTYRKAWPVRFNPRSGRCADLRR